MHAISVGAVILTTIGERNTQVNAELYYLVSKTDGLGNCQCFRRVIVSACV